MMTRFLRRADVEDLTGLSRSTIYAMMKRGEFPQGIAIGPRIRRWPSDQIERWQERQTADK